MFRRCWIRKKTRGPDPYLKVEAPHRSPLGIQAAGFQGAFNGGVSRVDLATEAMNIAFASAHDESIEQGSSDSGTARGLFDEHLDQFHGFSTELRPPLIGSVCESAQAGFLI